MAFVITNGRDYIKQNKDKKYVTIRSEKSADHFEKSTAINILNNQIPKRIRKGMHLKEVTIIPIPKKEVFGMDTWLKKIQNLNGIVSEAEHRKKDLLVELSNYDKSVSDVIHYIEFSNLNACQGYKAAKKIKELRQGRREVKRELELVDYIIRTNVLYEDATELVNQITHRTYHPKILKDLFEQKEEQK